MVNAIRVKPIFKKEERRCSCLFSDPIRNPCPSPRKCGCEILGLVSWRVGDTEDLVQFAMEEWPASHWFGL